jgi:dTDP-4-amino-4,6-dideoxygalactose transaminase
MSTTSWATAIGWTPCRLRSWGAKLPHLDAANGARRRLAARYQELLADTDLILPEAPAGVEPVWHLFVVRSPRRDELLANLKAQGIEAGIHYPLPLHLQPAYRGLGLGMGSFPVAEAASQQVLSLPLFPEMTDQQQERVVEVLRSLLC